MATGEERVRTKTEREDVTEEIAGQESIRDPGVPHETLLRASGLTTTLEDDAMGRGREGEVEYNPSLHLKCGENISQPLATVYTVEPHNKALHTSLYCTLEGQ